MTAPVAFGIGTAAGAILVLLAEAMVLWLHIRRAERDSTLSSFPHRDDDSDPTQPIPVLDRAGNPARQPVPRGHRR